MTPRNDDDHDLDHAARALHAQAVARVPVRTLHALRAGRLAAARSGPGRRPSAVPGWALAAACAAVFAVAVGLRVQSPATPPEVAAPVLAVADAIPGDDRDPLAAFDEDPDLYLWLASQDAQPLAME